MSVFAHVRRTGGGDVGESLLLSEGAANVFLVEGSVINDENNFALKEHID